MVLVLFCFFLVCVCVLFFVFVVVVVVIMDGVVNNYLILESFCSRTDNFSIDLISK